jgi:hypothetical protein
MVSNLKKSIADIAIDTLMDKTLKQKSAEYGVLFVVNDYTLYCVQNDKVVNCLLGPFINLDIQCDNLYSVLSNKTVGDK